MYNISNISELIKRGSATAKGGFQNEDDVVKKFNNWIKDEDAQDWLDVMGYLLDEIEKVEAIKITGSHKADVQVKIKILLRNTLAGENISVKLVSNPQGFNQIDKRKVDKYADIWAIPDDLVVVLKLFTGETPPIKTNVRDSRRMFLNEQRLDLQRRIVEFFKTNQIMIVTDILKGRDELAVSWMLIYQRSNKLWSLLPISVVMNYYGTGDVYITKNGNLRIGRIGMQRKGGDRGRETAKMLQFKINPAEIIQHAND